MLSRPLLTKRSPKKNWAELITHSQKSGVAHFACEDDKHCLLLIRELDEFFAIK
jgi:hypothetical protein